MRIKHRFVFDCTDTESVLVLLDRYKIKYESSNLHSLVVLELFEDHPHFLVIDEKMRSIGAISTPDIVYSKAELENAEWYTVRAKWRSEYPQPKDDFGYINATYNTTNHCPKCGQGLEQTHNFILRRTPTWKNRHFLMPNWLHDEFFTPDDVFRELIDAGLTGFNVRNADDFKTGEHLINVNQIEITATIPPGLEFKPHEIAKQIQCPLCGRKKRVLTGLHQVKLPQEVIEQMNGDILKTTDKFGEGLICSSKIIINRKFFDILKRNRWDKELYLQPVQLI